VADTTEKDCITVRNIMLSFAALRAGRMAFDLSIFLSPFTLSHRTMFEYKIKEVGIDF
jgi:hypothetical protein